MTTYTNTCHINLFCILAKVNVHIIQSFFFNQAVTLHLTKKIFWPLTLSWRRSLSYRNHLLCKSMDWFLHDRDLRHERVKDIAFHKYFFHILFFKKLVILACLVPPLTKLPPITPSIRYLKIIFLGFLAYLINLLSRIMFHSHWPTFAERFPRLLHYLPYQLQTLEIFLFLLV